MSKGRSRLVSLICLLAVLLSGIGQAIGAPTATLLTTYPVEVLVGEPYAVVAEITPDTADPVRLVARSAGNVLIAQSELLSGLQAGVPREVILYGSMSSAGLYDISQLQVVNGSGTVLHTLPVNALLLRVQEKPAQNAVAIKMGTFSVSQYQNGEFALRFPLRNAGTETARDVSIHFSSDPAFLRGNTNVLQVADIAAGGSRDISVKMGLSHTEATVFRIPIVVHATLPGGDKVTFEELITVTASDLGIRPESVTGTPRVFLKKYTLSSNGILAGDNVLLTLYIENSSSRDVRNLKISLAAVPAEGGSGGTVFSPVNSSNSFYVERIAAKKTYTRAIDLYVDPNAAARTYLVPVEILYEDAQGTAYSVSEMVSIPVLQESRLQILSVDTPPMAPLGQPVPVTAEFVNVGKVALKNLLVSIEGDFAKENASYFLASFEIGQSDYYQGFIIPQQLGLIEGKVVFKYTDNTNQEVVVEYPFSMDVQEMDRPGPMPGPDWPVDPPQKEGSRLLFWLLPLVVAVVGLAIFLWRRRVKRGVMFDEEL
jgi:hypothetical protein